MKRMLFLSGLLMSPAASGQTNFLGIKAGFTATNARVDNLEGPQYARKSFTAGITFEHLFKNRLSVSADLLYSQRGFRNDLYFVLPNGVATQPVLDVLLPYNYVAIPVRIGGNFGKTFYGFANAGLVPALLLLADAPYFAYNQDGTLVERGTLDLTHKLNRLDLAGIAEVGGGYKFGTRSRVFAAVSYQQSFTNTTNTQLFAGNSLKHNGITVALGFKWALRQKAATGTKPT